MAHLFPRRAPYVCKACLSAQISRPLARTFATTVHRTRSLREQLEERSKGGKPLRPSRSTRKIEQHESSRATPALSHSETVPVVEQAQSKATRKIATEKDTLISPTMADPEKELRFIQEGALAMLDMETIPDEESAHVILRRARRLADALVQKDLAESRRPSQQAEAEGEDVSQLKAATSSSHTDTSAMKLALAKTIYTTLEDPKLYISEDLLTTYVHTITTLSLPQYLPKIFHLYAHKPIPKPNTSSPIQYTSPWSRHPKYAVPLPLADLAIESAITARDMPLAISLIDTTVATPQFHISKFIRRASIPLTLSASVIPLSWTLSRRAADWQLSWDPDMFFWMCMAGAGAYLGTMGTLLLITVTTWNDHHRRVRWVPGTPMGRRWFREEERYYFDRIAESWGYKDENRHGEERGEEWEALREVCGLRWMEVDRSSLLPGML